MRQLELQLAKGYWDVRGVPNGPDAGPVKSIATGVRLPSNLTQIVVRRGNLIWMGAESNQLGMVSITTGRPTEHGPGEQALAPGRDESTGIEKRWVETPKSHCSRVSGSLG